MEGYSNLVLNWHEVEKKGPKNYTSSLAIRTTLKWVSKYDFIFANEEFCFFINHLHSWLRRIDPKKIRIWSKWAKERLNVTSAREPTRISQMGIKKLFYIFKPMISFLPNTLHSGLVKLEHRMSRIWEKGAQNYTCKTLKWASKYDFIFSNQQFVVSKITFIRG